MPSKRLPDWASLASQLLAFSPGKEQAAGVWETRLAPGWYKLNKQGDNIQPWLTPFLIWNQSVVPCPILTLLFDLHTDFSPRPRGCSGLGEPRPALPSFTQDWSPLGWTAWISLQSKGLSRVFSTPAERLLWPGRASPSASQSLRL